jgi:hypothetical protein
LNDNIVIRRSEMVTGKAVAAAVYVNRSRITTAAFVTGNVGSKKSHIKELLRLSLE